MGEGWGRGLGCLVRVRGRVRAMVGGRVGARVGAWVGAWGWGVSRVSKRTLAHCANTALMILAVL